MVYVVAPSRYVFITMSDATLKKKFITFFLFLVRSMIFYSSLKEIFFSLLMLAIHESNNLKL